LLQRVRVGGVGDDDVWDLVGHGLGQFGAAVDGRRLDVAAEQFQRQRADEPAEADDYDRFVAILANDAALLG
jgi:hypothetical protein